MEAVLIDYPALTPNWWITRLQEELNKFDLSDLLKTDRRLQVTDEHPLAVLMGGADGVSPSGILPAVAVVERSQEEAYRTLGHGESKIVFDADCLNAIKSMECRSDRFLIADEDLIKLNQWLQAGDLLADVTTLRVRESILIAIWTETRLHRTLLGKMVNLIVKKLRFRLSGIGIIDSEQSTTQGLVNFSFGRPLRGQETTVSYTFEERLWILNPDNRPLPGTSVSVQTGRTGFIAMRSGEEPVSVTRPNDS